MLPPKRRQIYFRSNSTALTKRGKGLNGYCLGSRRLATPSQGINAQDGTAGVADCHDPPPRSCVLAPAVELTPPAPVRSVPSKPAPAARAARERAAWPTAWTWLEAIVGGGAAGGSGGGGGTDIDGVPKIPIGVSLSDQEQQSENAAQNAGANDHALNGNHREVAVRGNFAFDQCALLRAA